ASTTAAIGGAADAGGAITVDAEIHLVPSEIDIPLVKPKATSVAVAGAASSGDVAIGGSFIVNDFHLDVDAHIASSSNINQAGLYTPSGDITVKAVNETKITAIAGALGLTSGTAGVGIGLDLEILHKTTHAY